MSKVIEFSNQPETAVAQKLSLTSICFLLASVFLAACALVSFATGEEKEGVAALKVSTQPVAIEDVQLGWRVVGDNPLGAEDDAPEPNSKTWKKVVLQHQTELGSLFEISLLRPESWFEKWNVEVGQTIDLALSEPGRSGSALVTMIEGSPEIVRGNGHVITGLFRHVCESGELVRLKTGNGESIVGTGNHQFWSESRQRFIAAANLHVGEELLLANGHLTKVASVQAVAGFNTVFNLETHNHHVYSVGLNGVLAHNMCANGTSDENSKVNIFGEGEAPAFKDAAPDGHDPPNLLINGGRPNTNSIPDGAAEEILVRNAPVLGPHNPNTIPEIDRLSKPGTRISIVNHDEADVFNPVLDHFGDRAVIITDKVNVKTDGFKTRVLQIRIQ